MSVDWRKSKITQRESADLNRIIFYLFSNNSEDTYSLLIRIYRAREGKLREYYERQFPELRKMRDDKNRNAARLKGGTDETDGANTASGSEEPVKFSLFLIFHVEHKNNFVILL